MTKQERRVAIVQSNYMPWRGYFDLVRSVDDFVFLDEVQFTRRDWRNRNQFKTPNGAQWLTVPVEVKGKFIQLISETVIADSDWKTHHLSFLRHNYGRAVCFQEVFPIVEDIYSSVETLNLSAMNTQTTAALLKLLNISTKLHHSRDFELPEGKNEKLLSICKGLNATCYVSGPSAAGYLDEELFRQNGVQVEFFKYGPYSPYKQLFGSFIDNLSILDLLFNQGLKVEEYIEKVA